MTVHINTDQTGKLHAGSPMGHEHPGPARHIPPHERSAWVYVEFDEQDRKLMTDIYGDEDTADAALEILLAAPAEIQILAAQIIMVTKEAA